MSHWRLWVPLALFLGFAGLAAFMLAKPKDEFVESRMVGKALPFFALRPATAERPGVASADFASGKPRLLNIFASWCLPCIAEARQLEMLAAQGVPIDGIAIRDRPEDVAQFLARHGNPYQRIGADDLSEVQLAIGSSGVPETFVIDGRGRIAYQHIGDIRAEHIPMLMEKLAEAGVVTGLHHRRTSLVLVGLIASVALSAPIAAQDSLPPAPYAYRQLDDPAQEAKARTLMENLRCLKCQSQSIADSDAPMAGDMRSQVRIRIAAGEEPDEIRGWLMERYGDYVSYDPQVSASTWPLFAGPLVLLLIAAVLMRRRFGRGSRA